jgi:hypothetical protein
VCITEKLFNACPRRWKWSFEWRIRRMADGEFENGEKKLAPF